MPSSVLIIFAALGIAALVVLFVLGLMKVFEYLERVNENQRRLVRLDTRLDTLSEHITALFNKHYENKSHINQLDDAVSTLESKSKKKTKKKVKK